MRIILITTYLHDTTSFTEGVVFKEGKFFDKTGGPQELPQTHSWFGVVNFANKKTKPKIEFDKQELFEGIEF